MCFSNMAVVWAVQEDRQAAWQFTCRLELGDRVQHRLGAAYGKHRHHGHASSLGQFLQQRPEFAKQLALWMLPVAIGRFDQHGIGLRWRLGRVHQRIVRAPEVTRKQDAAAAHFKQQARCAKNVASALETGLPAADGFKPGAMSLGVEAAQTVERVLLGIERQGRAVLGKAVPVGERGIFFLDVAAVGQQHSAQVHRAGRGVDGALVAFLDQQRDVAAVVQVRMREHHRIDLGRHHGQRRPVAQAQLLVTLEQPAIHQQPVVVVLDQVLGACDGVGSAEESDGDAHAAILVQHSALHQMPPGMASRCQYQCQCPQRTAWMNHGHEKATPRGGWVGHQPPKKPLSLSVQLSSPGWCLAPPLRSDSSNSLSSFFWCSVSFTGVSTVMWQYRSPG